MNLTLTSHQLLEYCLCITPKPPLHFYNLLVFEDIGNSLGSYMEIDIKRGTTLSLSTYDHICVEMDLSKDFLDKLLLKWKYFRWNQVLSYENTIFWYRIVAKKDIYMTLVPMHKLILQGKNGLRKNLKDGNFLSKRCVLMIKILLTRNWFGHIDKK